MKSILDLIGDELSNLFPDIPRNKENRKGGFEEPSFFVSKIQTDVKPELFDIQLRKYAYQIVYFPRISEPITDMENIEEILLDNFLNLKDFAIIRER